MKGLQLLHMLLVGLAAVSALGEEASIDGEAEAVLEEVEDTDGEATEAGMDGPEGIDPEMMANMMGGGGMGGMDPSMMADMMGGMGGGGMGDLGGMGGMGGMDPDMMAQMMGGGGMGMPGMGMGMGGGGFEVVHSDIKYLLCPACKVLVKRAVFLVDELREKLPNTKISEDRIDELLEGICEPLSQTGKWIAEYDLVVTDDDMFDLKRMPKPGHCQDECMTVGAACAQIYSEFGPDIVEKLWAKASKKEITELVCNKLSKRMKGSCAKPLKVPESRKEEIKPFAEKSEQDIAMDEINEKIRSDPKLSGIDLKEGL